MRTLLKINNAGHNGVRFRTRLKRIFHEITEHIFGVRSCGDCVFGNFLFKSSIFESKNSILTASFISVGSGRLMILFLFMSIEPVIFPPDMSSFVAIEAAVLLTMVEDVASTYFLLQLLLQTEDLSDL